MLSSRKYYTFNKYLTYTFFSHCKRSFKCNGEGTDIIPSFREFRDLKEKWANKYVIMITCVPI